MFEQFVLPFGATAAVYHFNLVAQGILFIVLRLFWVCATHYFDDFPVMELSVLAHSTQVTMDALFELLGWDTKEQEPVAQVFEPLGWSWTCPTHGPRS